MTAQARLDGRYREHSGECTHVQLATAPEPCPLHAGLEEALGRVEETVRRIDSRQEQTDERLWDVLEGLVHDRPSKLAIVQAARPDSNPPKPSLSPTSVAAAKLGPWAVTIAGVIGLGLGLGVAAGWARACGYQVPVPSIPSAEALR
jgi:hypothetical protein